MTTPLRTIDFIDAPLRGAPLVVLLVTMAASSGLIASAVGGGSGWALALLASTASWGGLAWALFAAHALFTVVVSPIEFRRYPGFLPRVTG